MLSWCIVLQDGDTALHLAASNGHTEITKILIDYHAAVDVSNKV